MRTLKATDRPTELELKTARLVLGVPRGERPAVAFRLGADVYPMEQTNVELAKILAPMARELAFKCDETTLRAGYELVLSIQPWSRA